jgi:fatty-acid desaturase
MTGLNLFLILLLAFGVAMNIVAWLDYHRRRHSGSKKV